MRCPHLPPVRTQNSVRGSSLRQPEREKHECAPAEAQSRSSPGGLFPFASSRAVVWQPQVRAQPESTTAHGADASLSSSTVTANAARDGVATGSGATTLGHAHTPRLARPENNPRSAAQRPDVDLEQDKPAPTNRPGSPGYTRVCAWKARTCFGDVRGRPWSACLWVWGTQACVRVTPSCPQR